MNEKLIPVKVLWLAPAQSGIAVFVGNDDKTFVIHVDQGVGTSIAFLMKEEKRERPLTHDLINLIFTAFEISVERILINDLRNDTYYARLTLKAQNEVHQKITEIDARPSDCLAIALETGKPIYVHEKVWSQVSDHTALLKQLKDKLYEEEENDEDNFL